MPTPQGAPLISCHRPLTRSRIGRRDLGREEHTETRSTGGGGTVPLA